MEIISNQLCPKDHIAHSKAQELYIPKYHLQTFKLKPIKEGCSSAVCLKSKLSRVVQIITIWQTLIKLTEAERAIKL